MRSTAARDRRRIAHRSGSGPGVVSRSARAVGCRAHPAPIDLIFVNFFYIAGCRRRTLREEAYDYHVVLLPGMQLASPSENHPTTENR